MSKRAPSLPKTGGTCIDPGGCGMVYINGHNPGCYRYTGPQQRLYCPASWLKQGVNELVAFDHFGGKSADVHGYGRME